MNRFIFAALLGYLAGLLSAPKKGSETRDDIKGMLVDLKGVGNDVSEAVQRKKKVLIDTAAPVMEQVQIEGKMLKDEGNEIKENAKQLFNESYERGANALAEAEKRILDKAAPAISLVKDDANNLKNQGSELLKKASSAFGDNKNASEANKGNNPLYQDASNM